MTPKNDELQEKLYQHCFIARQPIFSADERLWGYELLFRDSGKVNSAQVQDPAVATAQVIVDGVSLVFSGSRARRKALINIPFSLLCTDVIMSLPKDICVLEVLEDVPSTPEVLQALQRLKSAGYTLALDDYVGQEELQLILKMVDIVKVDFMGVPPHARQELTASLARPGLRLLAEKVETPEDVAQARKLGYDLFQGFFFQKPEIIAGRKVPSSLTAKMRALSLLSREDLDYQSIQELFSQNPQLTYRLLKFVNSAAFDKTQELKSLRHAMLFMGTAKLRRWLMAVLLADGITVDAKEELAFMGTVRAFFLQKLAESMHFGDSEDMFMLGLFSLLDSLYDLSFQELMKDIPLDERVKDALCNQKGLLWRWLTAVRHLERGNFPQAEELLTSLGVEDVSLVQRDYRDALEWAQKTLG